MKILINIPEEIYKASKIIDVQYEDVVQIPLEVIANGTPIPDNATNGDVIKVMFSNTEIMITDERVFLRDGTIVMIYPLIWWNSQYRKGDNE